MFLDIPEPFTPHPAAVFHPEVAARHWDRPAPALVMDLAPRPRVAAAALGGRRRASGRSVDTFGDAALVWSDVFLLGPRFECAYGEAALHQAWALGLRDAGSVAQRAAGLSIVQGRPWLDPAKLEGAPRVEGPVFFATPQEPHNWGLWLTACVPAIARFRDRARPGERLFCYRHHANMAATLGLLGVAPAQVVGHDVFAAYRLEEVTAYRPGAMDLVVTEAERAVFAGMVRAAGPASDAPRRILVTRRSAAAAPGARVLLDEEAIAARLARLGFVAIDPQAMTLEQQIRAFAAAEMVAGIGGAGLFNTVFCRPGTKVLSVEDSPTFLEMHANLFASLGHEYGFVLGVHEAGGAQAGLRWRADPAAVEAAALRFFGLAPAAPPPMAPARVAEGPPVPVVRYAAVPDGRMLLVQPPARYASRPPNLYGFAAADDEMGRAFLHTLVRKEVAVPAEAVMAYRDIRVLDGRFLFTREGAAVRESFADVAMEDVFLHRHPGRLAQLAAGTAEVLPQAGPPVVALFKEHGHWYGHLVAEILPRLVHLAEAGLRELRLLLPQEALPLVPVLEFALAALGLRGEALVYPEGSVLRVPELIWVTPVSGYNLQSSPTLLRLMERLRAAAGPADGPRRLFVMRPATARRALANAAEVAAVAEAAGFAVVEPSALPVARQVALFAGADHVAGPWGAGLVLSAAMAPGGRVTMIEPGVADFFFWDLACLAGLRFDWAFSQAIRPGAVERMEASTAIDLALLRDVLHAP